MTPAAKPWTEVLEEQHTSIFKVVEPLTDEQINWVHPHLSNTIGILLRHIAGSERYWIGEVVGGRPAHRERAKEFGHEPLAKEMLVEGLRQAYATAREVLEGITDADLLQEVALWERRFTKSWALLHSLTHTAYHLGQLQLFAKTVTLSKDS